MKNELSNIYANKVLVTESKKVASQKVKGPKVGELEGASKAKLTQGGTEKVKKAVKKPVEKKEFSSADGKPSKMKESQLPNAFDSIFKSVLNEEFGETDFAPETEDVVDQEFGDVPTPEPVEGEEEGNEENLENEEGDLTAKLQDLVSQLQDIVSKLSSTEEEEESEEESEEGESEEGGSEEGESEESPEEGESEDVEENPYEESLDLKGQLTELSNKLGDLLTKKTSNKVKGTLGKAKKGKASEGNVPAQDGKPKAFNPSLKSLQNPKGSNVVSNIKKGDSVIK